MGPFPGKGVKNPMTANFDCYPWDTADEECHIKYNTSRDSLDKVAGWCPDSMREQEYAGFEPSELERRLDYFPDGGGTGAESKGKLAFPTADQRFSVYMHEYEGLEVAYAKLKVMQDNGWIDLQTAWVGIKALVLNPDLGMFMYVTVNIYFTPSGMLVPHISAQTFVPEPYQYKSIITTDVLWVLLLLWYSFRVLMEFLAALRQGKAKLHAYLWSFWTFIDAVALLGGLGIIVTMLVLLGLLTELKDKAAGARLAEPGGLIGPEGGGNPKTPQEYEDMVAQLHVVAFDISYYMENLRLLAAYQTILICTKFMQSFKAQPRLAVVTSTLIAAMVDLIHFLIVLITFMFAFAVAGIFIFGRRMWKYSSVVQGLVSTFNMIMGDFDYGEMTDEDPSIASIYAWLFIFFLQQLMLNMLMAIIMDTYSEVKGHASNAETIWEQVGGYIVETSRVFSHSQASAREILEGLKEAGDPSTDTSDIGTEDLIRIVGDSMTEEQATDLISKARELEDSDAHLGGSMSETFSSMGLIKIKTVKINATLEEITRKKKRDFEALKGLADADQDEDPEAEHDEDNHQVALLHHEEQGNTMTAFEGQKRMEQVEARMRRMEEFMKEARQYMDFRSKDVRNRLAVVEDLLRSQRDAHAEKLERDVWKVLPRLGIGQGSHVI